jgi:hypothetical protein
VTEENKLKLNKMNKTVKADRKFELKNVAISRDGNYAATTGTGQDTVVQIFDVKGGNMLSSIDTNEIQNAELKMTPDDKYLTISTFMYEIAVIEFKKTLKFNKKIEGDEVTVKVNLILI